MPATGTCPALWLPGRGLSYPSLHKALEQAAHICAMPLTFSRGRCRELGRCADCGVGFQLPGLTMSLNPAAKALSAIPVACTTITGMGQHQLLPGPAQGVAGAMVLAQECRGGWLGVVIRWFPNTRLFQTLDSALADTGK